MILDLGPIPNHSDGQEQDKGASFEDDRSADNDDCTRVSTESQRVPHLLCMQLHKPSGEAGVVRL